jgi:8-oxo-dGTP diphosphatase
MYVNVRAIIQRRTAADVEIIIQIRNKPGQRGYEFPGGRLNEYESLIDGLKREVFEETGLHITKIVGAESKVDTEYKDTNVECMEPFAVYQTTKGPVDSMGVYFLCEAEGEPLDRGDETEGIRWVTVGSLAGFLESGSFSWADRAGLQFYLKKFRCEGVR